MALPDLSRMRIEPLTTPAASATPSTWSSWVTRLWSTRLRWSPKLVFTTTRERTTASMPLSTFTKIWSKLLENVSVNTWVPAMKATPRRTANAVARKRILWARSPRRVTFSMREAPSRW